MGRFREAAGTALWRAVVRRLARARGFPDPAALLSQISRFAQPAEVLVPTEILRLGLLLQARGLINGQAFQQNLDWIWPYWVEQQFDPRSPSFVPRAFSVTHINLTHRNWRAVGVPGCTELPIVDPRGLVTPFYDGWSIDAWVVGEDAEPLLPSRAGACTQSLDASRGMTVTSATGNRHFHLTTAADVALLDGVPTCRLHVRARASRAAWLVLALRPCNPEGLSLVHDIALLDDRRGWTVNRERLVRWSDVPERCVFSCYRDGDVFHHIGRDREPGDAPGIHCHVGTATAGALFPVAPNGQRDVRVAIPLNGSPSAAAPRGRDDTGARWSASLNGAARLRCGDPRAVFLFESALRTLILHTPGDVYAGPYTYKRFWFRDASLVAHALMCAGLLTRARRVIDTFAGRQDATGYFRSQEGEWDSNGQVLWAYDRFCRLSGDAPDTAWLEATVRGGDWIRRKRLPDRGHDPHDGLMPPGFSAEHLGTNDFYYWDDFWSIAGLHAAARLLGTANRAAQAAAFQREAAWLQDAVERSLGAVRRRSGTDALPASPYRRMDSAAVGSLVVGYPLQIWGADDRRVQATASYLLARHIVRDALFHDIAHSGLNPYLTLQLAQVLLRAGDPRFERLMDGVAALASSAGTWPEAVHPQLGTGCMGDGEHAWAAAEWIMMVRNCLVREEHDPARLVLCSGVTARWLEAGEVAFGPAPTTFGPVSVTARREGDGAAVEWDAAWRERPSRVEVRLPGFVPAVMSADASGTRLAPLTA